MRAPLLSDWKSIMKNPSDIFGSAKVSKLTFAKRNLPGEHPERFLFDTFDDWIDKEFESAGGGYVVYGLSKTGKTSFVEEAMERAGKEPIYIQGQDFYSVADFWERVADNLQLPVSHETTQESGRTDRFGSSLTSPVASLESESAATHSDRSGLFHKARTAHDAREALAKSGRPLVIDDFHNCGKDLSEQMSKVLKPLVRSVLVVLIAIPSESFSPVRETIDNTCRFRQIEFSLWSEEELIDIGNRGFPHLGYDEFSDAISKMAARECHGSPHIMQDVCLKISIALQKAQVTQNSSVRYVSDIIDKVLRSVAESSGSNIIDDLIKGRPPKGQERQLFTLTASPSWVPDGAKYDHYGIGLIALTHFCRENQLTIKVSAITEFLRSSSCTPSQDANRAGRTMSYFGRIADEKRGNLDPSLVYTSETSGSAASEVEIVDPFLAFYLANSGWVERARKVD